MNEIEQETILSEMGQQITSLKVILQDIKKKQLGLETTLIKLQAMIKEETALQWKHIQHLSDYVVICVDRVEGKKIKGFSKELNDSLY